MMKTFDPCFIEKNDNIFQVMQKINDLKNNENFFPVAIYLKENKIIGILSLGDIRRIAFEKIDFKSKAIDYLNKKVIFIESKSFDTELNNKINIYKKKRKFDFIITSFRKKIKIIKISDLENSENYKKTCVIGLGHIGLPLLIFLSNKTKNMVGYDKSKKVVSNLKKQKIPFYEKNLKNFLNHSLKNYKISLQSNLKKVNAQNYMICIGSELNKNKISNKNLNNIFNQIGKKINEGDLIILRGTMQIGYSRNVLIKILEKNSKLKCGKNFFFSYMPERIIEGDAFNELETLPQLVSGYSKKCKEHALNFARHYFDKIIELSSLEEAEIIKLASNSYRDLNFAFSNEVSRIASIFNLSGNTLIRNSNLGYHRNKIALPSIGVGGFCLPKDPILFSKIYSKTNIKNGYALGKVSRKVNNDSVVESYKRIIKLKKKFDNVLIMGATFKGTPETIDLRNSPSIELSKLLKKNSKKIKFYDVMQNEIINNFKKIKTLFNKNSSNLNNFDLIIIANYHQKYADLIEGEKGIKFNRFKHDKVIFDPWCMLNGDLIKKLNWKYINL